MMDYLRKTLTTLNAEVDSYKNPILVDGDIIHINKSIAGKTAQAIKNFP